MGEIGWLLLRTWACGTRGSRGERKNSIMPGDARTFVNPTCGASARLVDLYSNYVVRYFCFAFLLLFFFVFFLQHTIGKIGMSPAPVLFLGS